MDDGASKLPHLLDHRGYSLHIKNPKRNIFVTQLGERRDEDEDVNYIPIIRQAAGEILVSDSKTLQTTLVLKKEVEVDQVNAELAVKRQEFFQRMEAIAQRRVEFERREQVNKQRALKFDKFLRDTEAKRCRAIKKYQFEVKENEVKQKELKYLLQQFEEVKARHQKLQRKVSKYKVYEDYLLEVIDNLPENYLEYGAESLVMSIIRKHETLGATNENLINNLSRLSDEMEQRQHNLESLRQEYDTTKLVCSLRWSDSLSFALSRCLSLCQMVIFTYLYKYFDPSILMINGQLSQLRMECDEIKERNKQMELKLNLHRGNFIHQSEEFGALLLAINNLADQCYLGHYGILEEIGILTKLDMVKEFIMEKRSVAQMAEQTDSTSVFTGTSDQIQSKPGVTNQLKPQIKNSLVNSSKIITNQKNRIKPTNNKAR